MKIRVQYKDGGYDIIEDYALDELIGSDMVGKFLRYSEGWVRVGIDPIRGSGGGDYTGPERRRAVKHLQ